ncbi:MATE family efflux transporter [Marinibactrum halimedae]|uniref:MATE family efflux transporter n=1 Tax=Marinibactrum halimedae TaxID=1444977 RepID=A0AA37WJU8_9GAMM|nr:MATE family efflux transporter [Marinibactrum halimedae]MCD9461045.1 MATE family efflux transporter [Marinibactrum halimedae]GLS24423.1 MATE family efflux transporter [Marinibactrum halimedae]
MTKPLSNSSSLQPIEPNHKQIWSLAWPMIISNLSIPMVGIVDTAILGHLDSPEYLAAVATGASLITFLFWSFGFLRMGMSGLTANALGRRNNEGVLTLLIQGATLALVLGVILVLGRALFLALSVYAMNLPSNLSDLVRSYCDIRIYSAPFVLLNYALIGWFIGRQNTKIPLLILITTNVSNALFDWWFVIELGLSSDGAALASVLGEVTGSIIAIIAIGLALKKIRAKLDEHGKSREQKKHWQIIYSALTNWKSYATFLNVNRFLFVRTAVLLLVIVFFVKQGVQQGTVVAAANAVLMQLVGVISYGLDGFAHAAEALIGKAQGQNHRRSIIVGCQRTGLWAIATAAGFTAFFLLFKSPLLTLFSDIPEVLHTASIFYGWVVFMPLISVWGYQLDGIFIGLGKAQSMQNTILVSALAVFLPIWWVTHPLGNHGLWLAFACFNGARGISLFWVLTRYLRGI